MEEEDSSFQIAAINMLESSTYRIAMRLKVDREIDDTMYTPITCDCEYDKMTQLIAMKIGEAAPLSCAAP